MAKKILQRSEIEILVGPEILLAYVKRTLFIVL
jgi:hypothetical protein